MPNSARLTGDSSAFSVFLQVQSESLRHEIKANLKQLLGSSIEWIEKAQLAESVEYFETQNQTKPFQGIILIEHSTSSISILKMFLSLIPEVPVFIFGKESGVTDALKSTFSQIETLSLLDPPKDYSSLEESLGKWLKRLHATAKIPFLNLQSESEKFNLISEAVLLSQKALLHDVYIKVGAEGRMVRLFPKDMEISQKDLDRYSNGKKDVFFALKEDIENARKWLAAQLEKSIQSKTQPTQTETKVAVNAAMSSIKDIVSKVGFTPEAQNLAKSCVAMSIKALGSKPKLSNILKELRAKDGDYLLSHSMMVGQVACALAYKIGWSSSATFFKLSLAGFLHDISIKQEDLARTFDLEAAESSGKITHAQIQEIKLHTVRAMEYSRQFSEIPSDVDIILAQHHERPDGSGFPRGLQSKQISPLSSLFIMAHDLVHATYENPDVNIDTFFEEHAAVYDGGHFRKITAALKANNQAA